MRVLKLALIVAFAMSLPVYTPAQTSMLAEQNPVFNPGVLRPGTPTTWTFRTSTDDAVAKVLIDAQGDTQGAAPNGYAELALRTQDEIRGARNEVLTSSDVQASIRLMSHSYGYRTNPQQGECVGTQCPDMLEMYSSKNLRLTAAAGGSFDVVAGTRFTKDGVAVIASRLIINSTGDVILPDLRAAPRRLNYACFDESGMLVSQPAPCNRAR